MSDMQFVELTSTDPVERAIARKVVRILNDRTLDRQQREALVRRAQRELLQHRDAIRQAGTAGTAGKGTRRGAGKATRPAVDPITARRRELGLLQTDQGALERKDCK